MEKPPVRRNVLAALGAAALALALAAAGVFLAAAPSRAQDKPSVAEVMKRMVYYNQALGVQCDYCHVPDAKSMGGVRGDLDTPRKKTAKWMQEQLVDRLVTRAKHETIDCLGCHEGRARFLPSSQ